MISADKISGSTHVSSLIALDQRLKVCITRLSITLHSMEPPRNGKVCDICGDIGYVESLITCSLCAKASEHIYCMKPSPWNPPEMWFCDFCISSEGLDSTFSDTSFVQESELLPCMRGPTQQNLKKKNVALTRRKTAKISSLVDAGLFIPGKAIKERQVRNFNYTGINLSRSLKDAKVKFLPTEELACSASYARLSSARRNYCSVSSNRRQSQRTFIVKGPQVKKLCSNDGNIPSENGCTAGGTSCKVALAKSEIEASAASLNSRNKNQIQEITKCSTESKPENTCAALSLPDHVQHQNMSNMDCGGLQLLPEILEGILLWEGSFVISGINPIVYDGVQAYASSILDQRAFEASKSMPKKLVLNLVPQSDVWPKRFERESPQRDDAALYFWFDRLEREECTPLLERVDLDDLALRCVLQDVELLVFSSEKMDFQCPRTNMEMFLWGIFHRVSPNSSVPVIGDSMTYSFSPKDAKSNGMDIVQHEGATHVGMQSAHDMGSVDELMPNFCTEGDLADICGETSSTICNSFQQMDPLPQAFQEAVTRSLPSVKCEPQASTSDVIDFAFPDVPPGFPGLSFNQLERKFASGDSFNHHF